MVYLFSIKSGDFEGDYYTHNGKFYNVSEFGMGEVELGDDQIIPTSSTVEIYDEYDFEYDDDYTEFTEMIEDFEIETYKYHTADNRNELKTKLETEVMLKIIKNVS